MIALSAGATKSDNLRFIFLLFLLSQEKDRQEFSVFQFSVMAILSYDMHSFYANTKNLLTDFLS